MLKFKTEKQKDNLAKFLYDLAKIILGIMVITPLAKPEEINLSALISGIYIVILCFLYAYYLDGKEVKS